MIVFERRAAAILYNLLRTRADERPYLLPANVCPIVPDTLAAAGQAFELADITEPWLEIDPTRCAERLRQRSYAGLIFVHPYGSERDGRPAFAELRAIQPDLFIIDDRCLCRPDTEGTTVSPLADVTLFSTGRVKYADLGGGGFAHIAGPYARFDAPVPEWLDLRAPDEPWEAYKRRADEAAVAADRQKAELNAIYTALLPREAQFRPELQQWRFNIRVPDPDRLIASIFEEGLFASRHYPSLGGESFPVASRIHGQIVNLFNDRHFDDQRARRIVEVVLRHLDVTQR